MGKKFKLIAITLIFVIFFQVASPTIYGIENLLPEIFDKNTTIVQKNITKEITQTEEQATIIGEDISKREFDKKYFLLSDGSMMAAVYPFAVHYEDKGVLKEINNTLQTVKDEENEDNLENVANTFHVKLAKKANKNKLITIRTQNFKLKWSLENANKVEAIGLEKNKPINKKVENVNQQKMMLDNLSSSVIYENILQDVNIQYDLQADTIKESIILQNKNATQNDLIFHLDTEKLEAEINEQKQIILYNGTKENIIYQIEPMFMYDANQEYSNQVEIQLEKEKKGYKLTIIPNQEWLNDEQRQYPVTLDPTISTSIERSAIQHSYIFNGDQNYPTRHEAHVIRVGSNNKLHYPTRGLIKFTLPTLNAGDQVIWAGLDICSYKDYDTPNPSREMQIDVHKITKDWGGVNTYWDNLKDSYDSKIEDYIIYQFDANNWFQFKSFAITSIVKDWYTTGNNYGLMLKEHNEGYNYADSDAYFISSDTSSAYEAGRPIVTIVYRNQTGLENYLSYHTQDAGRAGIISTNNYNGNVVWVHNDLATPGNRLPVQIYHVYNSNDKDVNIGYGNGIRLNLTQMVSLETIDKKEYAKYIDEDSTIHYFLKKDNTNIYIDEDGLELKLTHDGNMFTMEDKAGNKSIFSQHADGINLWHLKEIQDTNGNTITLKLEYNNRSQFQITEVTDGAGDKLTLGYGDRKLVRITDTDGRNIQYSYHNDCLTQITYPDSKISSYTYTANKQLQRVTNIDNSHIDYTYYHAQPYRVKNIKEYSNNNEMGSTLEIQYDNNLTTFQDNKGYISNIVFNNMGQAISITDLGRDNDSSKAYGLMYQYGTDEGSKNKLTLQGNLRKHVNNLILNGNAEIKWKAWDPEEKGTNQGSKEYTNSEAYYGSKSLKVSTSYQNNTFPAWSQAVNIKKSKNYTISAYVKTEGINCTGEAGAVLYVEYTNASGQMETKFEYVKTTQDWDKTNLTFTYPENAQNLRIGVGVRNTSGTAYFDGIQLEEGDAANTFNLIENSSFQYPSNIDESWERINCTSDDGIVTDSQQNNSFRITGDVYTKKEVAQSVYVSGKKDDVLNLAFWVNTQGIQRDKNASRIAVGIVDTAGQRDWIDVPIYAGANGWQYVSEEIIAKKDFVRIDVNLCFHHNVNVINFKNIGLYKDEFGQSYSYDENGNMISAKDKAKETLSFKYNGNGKLLKEVNPLGGKYTYEYDYWHKARLLNATNTLGINYAFTYDSYGNETKVKVEEASKTASARNGKKYFIRSASSGKYFDVPGASTENGSKIQQYDIYQEADNQKYILYDVGEGYFKIVPTHKQTKCLDLHMGKFVLIQWDYSESDNQKWKFVENEDGTYRMINKAKGEEYCLSIEKDKSENGANIIAEKWEGKLSQKFQLREVGTEAVNPADQDFLESNEVYHIRAKSSNLYLEQSNDTNGSSIVQKVYDGKNTNQLWRIVRDENNHYRLLNQGSITGKVLEVPDGDNRSGKVVQMWDNAIPNITQNWQIRKQEDGTYGIVTCLSGTQRGLSVQGNLKDEGRVICLYDMVYDDNQKFYLEKAGMLEIENGATYKIKARNSGLYLGVNGSNVEQQNSNNLSTQQWIVENLNNGYYKLISKQDPSKVLDVDSYSEENGANVHVYADGENNAQKFEIVPTDNGTYSIRTRVTKGKSCLDIAEGSTSVGANVQQYQNNNSYAQQFYFEKVSSPNTKKYVETSAEYTNNGNYLSKTIDQRGNSTTYRYNETTGTISTITDAKQTTTNYTYDNLDRIKNIAKTVGNITYQNSYSYENDRIKTIAHNGFNYQFLYNSFGNTTQVKVGNQTLITNQYDNNNGNLNSVVYGNNQTIQYRYDRFDRINEEVLESGNIQYTYDARGNIGSVQDEINQVTTQYTYDLAERLAKIKRNNGQTIQYTYDKNSNINKVVQKLKDTQNEVKYEYDKNDRINSIKTEKAITIFQYDALSRLVGKQLKTVQNKYQTTFTYEDTERNNKTTTLVKSVKNGDNQEISYTYDINGNIETIKIGNDLQAKYYYDALNQLIREDNKVVNKTITYEYDAGGNRLKKKEYYYTEQTTPTNIQKTITYTYGNNNWKDQLTNYNGKTITYDGIGNPLTYNGNSYTWENGRQLKAINGNGKTINYKYNEEGIRTEKTVNGKTTKYYLEGNKVIYEEKENNILYYTYDEQGNIIGVKYNNDQYYYIKNAQNDIIGILDSNLNQMVKYTYDTWGKVNSIENANGQTITDSNNIGNINPYRYRSYYYDIETEMYYLQSRYYNPDWGRFINADGILTSSLLGNNIYTYCGNNPVNFYDPTGELPTIAIGLLIIGLIIVASSTISSDTSLSDVDWSWTDNIQLSSGGTTTEKYTKPEVSSGISCNGFDYSRGSHDKEFDKKLKNKTTNKGYKSFNQLKKAIGSPGEGNQWHHIVEQSQIRKSGFDVQIIQSEKNIIAVSKEVHRKISGYYNTTTFKITNGLSIRNWLAGQSFETQYKYGTWILKRFGVL